jgi:protein-L-isoaspartate(D-aspartate) O-methyltransferase
MSSRSQQLRSFYACLIAGEQSPRVQQAFAAVPREPFVGPGPWFVMANAFRYAETPNDDPVFIYQDVLVALDASRGLNIGSPSAHAVWLAAVDVKAGETVLQVGTGSGYYSAILAELVGPEGRVHAYEIDADLAARAAVNLKHWPQVDVRAKSGIADDLPKVDVVYVCAGITQPSWTWIDALRPGGRLLFPLQPDRGLGGMLMITRPQRGLHWPAKFVSRARFIPCEGQQDPASSQALTEAFAGQWAGVKSFRIDEPQDETCWFAGDGWWLSTATPETDETGQ